MKATILLLTAAALLAPVAAQEQAPGTDLLDLFDKSQREGATDDELIQMLENKALIDPQEFRELTPEELRHEQDAVFDILRRLNRQPVPGNAGGAKDDVEPGPKKEVIPPQPPRWLVGLVVKPLDPALRAHFDLPEGAGVVVESVMRGGPAAEAGIKQNDIIVTANGRKISTLEALKTEVEKSGSEGKSMNLEVIQRGKKGVVKLMPRGPEALTGQAERKDPAATRPMIEIQRRLDQQQQEIEALRREVRELRSQRD
jgi:hypothetical protein